MKTEKQADLDLAFVLTKKDISKINEIVRNYLGTNADVQYRIRCRGNIKLNWDSATPLQDYENPSRKAIEQLEINGTSKDCKKRVSIELGRPHSTLFAVDVQISGDGIPEASIHNAFQSLEDVCEGMKPWYNRLATTSFVVALLVVLCLIGAITFVIMLAKGMNLNGPINTTHLFGWMLGSVCGTVLPGVALFVQSRVFPKATFSIGQGEKRHQNGEILRLVIIVGFVINVVAGVVVSLLFV